MPRPVDSSLLPLLVVALTLPLWLVVGAAPDAAKRTAYTTRFDNIDLERILSSRRLVANYVDCLLGRKRCTPEGAELKRVLPDALATRCARCSERQREAAVRAIRLLRQRYPDLWAPLQLKWDPTGEHTRRLEQAMARRARAGPALPTATNGPAGPTATSKAAPAAPKGLAGPTARSKAAAAADTVSAARNNSAIFADTTHDTPVTPAVAFVPYTATLSSAARSNSANPAAAAKRNISVTPAGLTSSSGASLASAARSNSAIPASRAVLHSPVAVSAPNTVAATKSRTSSEVPIDSSAGPVSVSAPNPAVDVSPATAKLIPVVPTAAVTYTGTSPKVSQTTATPAEANFIPAARVNSVIPAVDP